MHGFCSYCVKALLRYVLSEHAQHAVWPATAALERKGLVKTESVCLLWKADTGTIPSVL